MAARSVVHAGIAFATAGMIAAVPAIAPPLTPRDVQIVKNTEVDLTASLYQALVNTFFGVFPDTAPGFPGLSQQLLRLIAGNDLAAQALIQGFYDVGASDVLRQILVNANPDYTDGVDAINVFFNEAGEENPALFGAPGVLYWRLAAAYAAGDLTDDQWTVIDDFFQGGATQVVRTQLTSRFQDPQQQLWLNSFFDGGATQLAYEYAAASSTPELLPAVNTFFNVDNPLAGPDEDGVSENPALFGVSGLTYLRIRAAGLDPDQQQVVDDFFGGGISQVARTQILARTGDTGVSADLVNEFFDNGVSGVVRYLLAGPFPPAEDPAPVVQPLAAARSSLPTAKVEMTAPQVVPVTTPVSDPAPAADPAPATDPAPTGDSAPKFTAKVRDQSVAEEKAAAEAGDASEATDPEILLTTGGAKPGTGSWGIFGQIAKSIHKAIADADKPKPKPASATSTTDSGDGGSSDGGDGGES